MSEMSSQIVNPLNDSQSDDDQSSDIIRQDVISENNTEGDDKNPLMDSDGEEQQEEQLSLENMTNQQKGNLQDENEEGTKLEYHVCQTQLVWDEQNEGLKTNYICSCDDVKIQQLESNFTQQKDSDFIALQQEIQSKDSQIQALQQQNQDIQKAKDDQIQLTTKQQKQINELKNIIFKLRNENDSLKNDLIQTQKELHQVTLLLYQDQRVKTKQQEMTHRSKTSTDFAEKQQNYQVQPSNATLNDNNLPPLSPHEQSIVKVTSNSKMPNPFTCKSAKNNYLQEESSLNSGTRRSFQLPPQANGIGRSPKLDNQQQSLKDLIHKAQLTQLLQKSKTFQIQKVNGQNGSSDSKFFISKKPLIKIPEPHPQI